MYIKILKYKNGFFQVKYDVSIDGSVKYRAKKIFSINPTIKIYNLNNHEIGKVINVYTDVKNDSPRYDIIYRNHFVIRLITESIGIYKLNVGTNEFTLFGNGNSIGLFDKKNQVGLIKYKIDSAMESNIYEVFIDPNIVEVELVVGFVLAYDHYYGKIDSKIYNKEKTYNENWRP
jgi:hypothetical protein